MFFRVKIALGYCFHLQAAVLATVVSPPQNICDSTNTCFWIVQNGSLTWEQSRNACQNEGGGDLAVLDTKERWSLVSNNFSWVLCGLFMFLLEKGIHAILCLSAWLHCTCHSRNQSDVEVFASYRLAMVFSVNFWFCLRSQCDSLSAQCLAAFLGTCG